MKKMFVVHLVALLSIWLCGAALAEGFGHSAGPETSAQAPLPEYPDHAIQAAGRPNAPKAMPRNSAKPQAAPRTAPGKAAAPKPAAKPKVTASPRKAQTQNRPYVARKPIQNASSAKRPATWKTKPHLWSDRGKGQSERAANLHRHWHDHARKFKDRDVSTPAKYRAEAVRFTQNPPRGTQVFQRVKPGVHHGDMVFYHKQSNTFAVTQRDGTPRTFFKPDGGPQGGLRYFRDTFRKDREP